MMKLDDFIVSEDITGVVTAAGESGYTVTWTTGPGTTRDARYEPGVTWDDGEGFVLRGAGARLRAAATALWRIATAGPDPMGDPSGDCGDLIAAGQRRAVLAAVTDAGYATPGEYNTDLHRALGVPEPDSEGRTAMTEDTWCLLGLLEVGDACPACGAALDVTSHRTRAYGGGWDTAYRCPACGWADICT